MEHGVTNIGKGRRPAETGRGAGLSKKGSIGFVFGGTHTDIPKVSAFYLYLCIMVFYSRLYIDVLYYAYLFSAAIW